MSPSTGQTSVNVYQTCDAEYLRQLREAAGMDTHVLAKMACLSLGQVRELENGTETGVFYSESIRRQAYKRLLLILGAEPPQAAPVEVPVNVNSEHQAQLQSLDQIAAMSRLPSIEQTPWIAPLIVLGQRVIEHKQAVAAGGLLVLASVLLVLNWPAAGVRSVLTTPVQAASETLSVASESVQPASANLVLSASEPASIASLVAVTPVAVSASAASAPAKPASSAAVAAVAPPVAANRCAFSTDALPHGSPMVASKPGRYVYFVSTANVELCVVDGAKQATILSLKNGENRSVYGVPPWQVSSANLNKVQVFFQGGRVVLPSESAQHMTLIEKTIAP